MLKLLLYLVHCLELSVQLPSKALSISLCVGKGLFLSRAYMDITIPGVQNPHWDP